MELALPILQYWKRKQVAVIQTQQVHEILQIRKLLV